MCTYNFIHNEKAYWKPQETDKTIKKTQKARKKRKLSLAQLNILPPEPRWR
jgi:hypothetical protein